MDHLQYVQHISSWLLLLLRCNAHRGYLESQKNSLLNCCAAQENGQQDS